MESIEQMINRLCPNGVEWKKISEICVNICSGGTPSRDKSEYFMGNIPWLRTQEVNWTDVFDTEIKITEEALKNSSAKIIPVNCVIVAMYGATAAKACINKIELTTNQACCNLQIDSEKALYKYVYYWICNKYELLKNLGEGSQSNLNAQKVKDFLIPVPPMEIQNRIVEVLDKMTTLTAELEAELEARKQQYEYYRNKLLTFNEIGGGKSVIWKKISEIGTVMRGTSFQKKHFTDEGTPCIHYGQIYTQYAHHAYETISFVGDEISRSPRRAKTGAIVMATTSENIEDVGKCIVWLGEDDVIVSNDACFIQHTLNPKYLGYLLQTESFSTYKKKVATGTKVIRINADAVADFMIPVPSMEEQERIVSILDRFEALTTDLQSGLPAEIEARRQQYEYYRNKLLTFDKAA